MKVNYQSDFKIVEKNLNGDNSTPFKFTYFTTTAKTVIASYDGSTYVNCRRLPDGSVLVPFDKPEFSVGNLMVRREYFLTDTDFADGICNLVSVEDTGIILWKGKTDGSTNTIDVYPNYQKGDKGDPLVWESMTQAQREELKTSIVQELPEGSIRFTSIDGTQFTSTPMTETLTASASTTELKQGLYFNGKFNPEPNGNFWTIVFNQSMSKYEYVDLSQYNIGVTGGAVLNAAGEVISEFSTAGTGGDSNYRLPIGADKLAVSVIKAAPYGKSVIGKWTEVSEEFHIPNLMIRAEQIEDLARQTTYNGNQWYGKKLCIIGTSVAYGSNATKAYAKIASERLGFSIMPACVPGLAIHARIDSEHGGIIAPLTYGSTVLSKAEYEAAYAAGASTLTINGSLKPVNGEDWRPGDDRYYSSHRRTWENVFTPANADTDLWLFAVTPNNTDFALTDWNAFNTYTWEYTDGSSFADHRTTFLGALLFLMDKMYTLNPNARMALVLDSEFEYANGKAAFEKLRTTWCIPVIDLWGKMNTSPKSLEVIKSKGGTDNHPSTFGQERLGDMFANELLLIS